MHWKVSSNGDTWHDLDHGVWIHHRPEDNRWYVIWYRESVKRSHVRNVLGLFDGMEHASHQAFL